MDQMRARGLNKPVWVNETNLPVCSDPVYPGFPCPQTFRGTPEEQANFIIQAYAEAIAVGLQKLFIFQLYDDGVGPNEYYGLIRNNGSPRPAYQAYAVAAGYLANATRATRLIESAGRVERIVVEMPSRTRVTVLWNRTPTPLTHPVPATNPTAYLIRKDGNGWQTPITTPNAFHRITLPGATNTYTPGVYHVGGDPFILIEHPVPFTRTYFFPLAGR
jgi:hypothetical protein